MPKKLEVLAGKFSNINLTCLVDSDESGCPDYLHWYLNDNNQFLAKSEKYDVVTKKTRSKCKKEFILSIFNVTKNDEGNYSCHWECEYEKTKTATIDLKVFVEPLTGKNLYVSVMHLL